jgi:hypothetical protein
VPLLIREQNAHWQGRCCSDMTPTLVAVPLAGSERVGEGTKAMFLFAR